MYGNDMHGIDMDIMLRLSNRLEDFRVTAPFLVDALNKFNEISKSNISVMEMYCLSQASVNPQLSEEARTLATAKLEDKIKETYGNSYGNEQSNEKQIF